MTFPDKEITKASVPRAFSSDSFESSIVIAPLFESKLTTVPSCEVKKNNNKKVSKHGEFTATVKWRAGGIEWFSSEC